MVDEDGPRVSADALLADAEREGRGRLRIFLGAAPGVGKTYAMLQAARAAVAAGRDVAIGVVETHGRPETEALLAGLEIIPRKGIAYRGRLIPEFDLDAALKRRPQLLLVDEYAHSNVPGSRHPKRWRDLQDCLKAGIDVWTTMNVQHVESLNDVVQRITGVRVRETVPDSRIEAVDEIVLVDLPSDELIRRLGEGKVYVEDTATRAKQSFFRPNNLTALRELALRQVASRVDSELIERMQGSAIEGPWPAGERLLVAIGGDGAAEGLVREAKRLADLLGAHWFAVTIDRPGHQWSDEQRRCIDGAMKLAGDLGAQTMNLVGTDLPGTILKFARVQNVTQIVVGKARRPGIAALLPRATLAQALVGRAEGIAVHVLTSAPTASVPRRLVRPGLGPSGGYLVAAACVLLATLAGVGVGHVVDLPNLSMLYLLAVVIPAIRHGVLPAIFASLLSFLAYNLVFIQPTGTLTIARPHEFLALAIFLIIAVSMATLAGRLREQNRSAVRRTRAARRLYQVTRRLSALPDPESVGEAAVYEVHAALERTTILLGPDDNGGISIVAAWPPEDRLDMPSKMAALWAFEHDEPAGSGTETLPGCNWLFHPLNADGRRVGVLGIEHDPATAPLDGEGQILLQTLGEQVAAALHRARLSTEIRDAKAEAETERIRNTLLASISHDFRTPLSSILGSATSLLDYGSHMDGATQADLLGQIRDEAGHLDGMVRNLLAITRLEAGSLDLRRDWVDIADILNRAVAAARRRGAVQTMLVCVPPGLPLAYADQSLLEQAVGNVLGNALRHAGEAAHIVLQAAQEGRDIVMTVADDGPGIAPDMAERIFDKFVSGGATRTADGSESAGLGLAIARGVMQAHGGSATLEPTGTGARFALRMPIDERVHTP